MRRVGRILPETRRVALLRVTGRGTPFGCPVPTVKISSSSALYHQKKNWIDFNAGDLLEGISLEEKSDSLYELVRAIASGEIKAKSEKGECGESRFLKTVLRYN
jgi:altronate dehydratase